MTAWALVLAPLIFLGALFGVWWLVQGTAGPRRYFRAGIADPERGRFPRRIRGRLAPQTVEESPDAEGFDAPITEQASAVIEGERHGPTPLRAGIDGTARGLVEEERARQAPSRGGGRRGVAPADEPAWGTTRPFSRRPGDPRGYRP
ncbi:hypothetical protein [Nocardiopsis baichengensis]|uniref:hypothetical protein n=1 Tax=Nocardiopsis baichengensis TaxID=280240 RepID=UPI00034D9B05|nr:hypothetical protein [Nocardiopsis baichengensis]